MMVLWWLQWARKLIDIIGNKNSHICHPERSFEQSEKAQSRDLRANIIGLCKRLPRLQVDFSLRSK